MRIFLLFIFGVSTAMSVFAAEMNFKKGESDQWFSDKDVNGNSIYDSNYNEYSEVVGTGSYTLSDLAHHEKSNANLESLTEFRAKYVNFAVTGGAGSGSGTFYIPVVGLWGFVDNNATNIDLYQEDDLATEWGNWDLDNFGDPEWADVVRIDYDANGKPEFVILVIGEESCTVGNGCAAGQQRFAICKVPINTTTQDIDRNGASCQIIDPTGMWTNDATLGWEAGCYDIHRNVVYGFKQDNNFEFRVIPLDGTTTPAATEPWDAETILGATLPAINDCTYDQSTRTLLLIGDATGADSNNQDIVRINPLTGAIIENWQSYTDTLGLNLDTRTDWPQGEGIGVTPDGKRIGIGSETDNFAILERPQGNSIYTEYYIDASEAVLDDTLPPGALAVVESTGTGTPRFNTLQFDPAQDEFCYLTFVVPSEFRLTAIPIQLEVLWYSNDTGATENPIWAAQVSATTEGDADTVLEQAATAANTVSDTVNATEANRLISSTISLSTDDSIAAGDLVTITFYRDGDAAGDDLTSDAIVIGWRLRIPRK